MFSFSENINRISAKGNTNFLFYKCDSPKLIIVFFLTQTRKYRIYIEESPGGHFFIRGNENESQEEEEKFMNKG